MTAHSRWEPTTGQRVDIVKVHISESMGFIVVAHRSIGEGQLTGAETTQRQLCITKAHLAETTQSSCITKAHPGIGNSLQS